VQNRLLLQQGPLTSQRGADCTCEVPIECHLDEHAVSTALDAAHVSGGQHKSKVAPDWATTAVYALQIKEQMQDEAYQSSADN